MGTDTLLDRLLHIYSADGPIVIDIESNHAHIDMEGWELWGVGFRSGGQAAYVKDLGIAREVAIPMLASGREIVGHNVKFDLRGMRKGGIIDEYPEVAYDTMIGMNLLNENLHPDQLGLKILILDLFGHKMSTYEESSAAGRDSAEFAAYNEADLAWTERLYLEVIKPRLEDEGLWRLFEKIYGRKLIYLCDEEDTGVTWDVDRAKELMFKFAKLRDIAEKEVKEFLGDDILLSSHKQVRERLFDDMGISSEGMRLTKKTKVVSLDADGIEIMAHKIPTMAKLIDFRNAGDMINKFILPNTRWALQNKDRKLYPNIYQTSATGRKRVKHPNVQQQPNIGDQELSIRDCITTISGHKLIVADLSQIELRLCTEISKDKEMLQAYRTWDCGDCGKSGDSAVLLLSCPACGAEANPRHQKDQSAPGFWHGLDIHQITSDLVGVPRNPVVGQKASSKSINFALIYCATAWLMEMQFGTYTVKEWEGIIEKFFQKYTGVKRWHMWSEQRLRSHGWFRGLFGRIRRIPKQSIEYSFKHALNQFANAQIQTPAAHWLDLASINIRNDFKEAGVWRDGIYPLMEVHDELVFLCRDEYVDPASEIILDKMRHVAELSVPVDVELKVLERWGGMKG